MGVIKPKSVIRPNWVKEMSQTRNVYWLIFYDFTLKTASGLSCERDAYFM